MKNQHSDKSTVFLVDDDAAIRDSLSFLLESVDLPCATFESAHDFLDQYEQDRPGCMVLDIRMPGMSGLELQERLNEMRCILPIIFVTGHGDVPMAVGAMQSGATDFIEKPFRDQELLDRIHEAIKADRENRSALGKLDVLKARWESLTKREQEVMELVVAGKPNKVIAYDLGVSQRTVEIHRARVMEKMQAGSLAHLVRMDIALRQNDAPVRATSD